MRRSLVVGLLVLLGVSGLRAEPILGDYDAEPRVGGHVDIPLLTRRLQDLGANTYFWLIWHSPNDWDDLQAFLPVAKQAGIRVWAYLVPPSETAVQNPVWPYSEPFRLDYVRWAQEIARLSLRQDNLVGYVIDDFWGNVRPDRFTPQSIQQMVAAGKAINPRLRFYPLMYFPELGLRFLDQVAPLVDGVVAAYPQGRADIERALAVLEDRLTISGYAVIAFPASTRSQAGEAGWLAQRATVTDAAQARLRFRFGDDYDGPTTGYHKLQLRVDDRVVWEQDSGGRATGEAEVDLSAAVAGKPQVTLRFGVWEQRGVAQYALRATFSDVRATGLVLAQPELNGAAWQTETTGAFTVEQHAGRQGQGRLKLPLIVMTAAQRHEYEFRYQRQATPERLADDVRLARSFGNRLEGVVTYCLDKRPDNPDLAAVAKAYRP